MVPHAGIQYRPRYDAGRKVANGATTSYGARSERISDALFLFYSPSRFVRCCVYNPVSLWGNVWYTSVIHPMQLSRISLFPSLREEEDVGVEEEIIIPEPLQWKPEGNGFADLEASTSVAAELPGADAEGVSAWEDTVVDGELVCDVYETDRDVIVVAPIAGIRSEDLDITVANDLLTVRGTRRHGVGSRDMQPVHLECHWGSFSRSLVLPSEVRSDRVKAFLKQGVLTILLPKIRESRVRVEDVGI